MVASTDSCTVVVGCDGSWHSYRAVDVAAREAAQRGCRLTLLVVPRDDVPHDDEPLSGYSAAERRGRSRAHVTAQLARERALAAAPHVGVDIVVDDLDGPALQALAERAAMLVVGGHGRGGQRALSLSSLSDSLVRRLRVPIMIPGEGSPTSRTAPAIAHLPRVVVGVDGRGGEEELISIAAVEARARDCSMVIVRAVRPDREGGVMARPQVWDETWMAVRQADKDAAVSCRVVVTVDEPVAALTGECGPDDLLVVGTRGQGRLAGLVPGSVARGVLDAGICDVMVVPPSAVGVPRPGPVKE
ncbi:MAG: universal stress protein [Knoellia sp.]